MRKAVETGRFLIVLHTFENAGEEIVLPLVDDICEIEGVYARDGIWANVADGKLFLSGLEDYDGIGIVMETGTKRPGNDGRELNL